MSNEPIFSLSFLPLKLQKIFALNIHEKNHAAGPHDQSLLCRILASISSLTVDVTNLFIFSLFVYAQVKSLFLQKNQGISDEIPQNRVVKLRNRCQTSWLKNSK